jgi:4-hydroxy-tetrahydrodipicolinate synthase
VALTFAGCYTALVTPMRDDEERSVDYDALRRLVEFQVAGGVSGLLAVGTTGESPTLNWEEHADVIVSTARFAGQRCTVIGGTGSNSTAECVASTHHVVEQGLEAILLVEPYYNGPSSLEIRREYMEPVARRFPDVEVIPYVIPGRTGTQLLPEDLAILHRDCPNVNAVKEASADLENMRRTREACGDGFTILSGDDGLTYEMMTDARVAAAGVVSVASNVAPAAVQRMTEAARDGDEAEARRLAEALRPLFDIVTVKTREESAYGPRLCKARNPLPVKTLMRLLGMPVGPPRQPLGKMTPAGLDVVLSAARKVWDSAPEVLEPLATAFDVDIERRLADPQCRQGLTYEDM